MQRAGCNVWVWACALALTLALPASARADAQPGVALSEGPTFAYWAHPEQRAVARSLPSPTSRRIARIHLFTEHGFPEVYPVLRRVTGQDRRTWLQVRIPMRPDGRVGWVRDSALSSLYRVRTRLVVERGRLRATLYRSGRRIWTSPVGVGKAGTPTPAGRFWIREGFRVAERGGMYGPWAFGTSSYSRLSNWPGGGVIGIHGTNEPYLIPGRPSHGCIRLPNPAISRLRQLMPIGTPLEIR